ncbi:MAG: hypothetical protein FJ288_06015 [Planctomycetes bacterium]|nr:hypothetical protein [Planctomycetota bacterium]
MDRRRLVVFAAACTAAFWVSPAGRAPAESAPGAIETQESAWDVFAEGRKVGRARFKIMTVRDLAIIDQEFSASIKGKETAFDSQVTYRVGPPPRPERARVSTRLGQLKLMEGTLAFGAGGVKADVSGYADKEQKPLVTALQASKDVPVPQGVVLTYAALMFFAPRVLPEPGRAKAAYMEFPADLNFPDIVFFNPDCVLSRSEPGPDGRTEFALRRMLAGGNAIDLAVMTVDKAGKVQEVRLRRFTFRPEGAPPPAAPAPAKAGPPK